MQLFLGIFLTGVISISLSMEPLLSSSWFLRCQWDRHFLPGLARIMNYLYSNTASPMGLFSSNMMLLLSVVSTGTCGQLEEIGEEDWSR